MLTRDGFPSYVPLGWVLLCGSQTEHHGSWWGLRYTQAQEGFLFPKHLFY